VPGELPDADLDKVAGGLSIIGIDRVLPSPGKPGVVPLDVKGLAIDRRPGGWGVNPGGHQSRDMD